jgi:hypothetical protein
MIRYLLAAAALAFMAAARPVPAHARRQTWHWPAARCRACMCFRIIRPSRCIAGSDFTSARGFG